MKRTILVLTLLFCAAAISYSQIKVPEKVKTAFETKFPKAESVKWRMDDDDYSSDFTFDSVNYFAGFDDDGKWTETGVAILFDNLPDAVKQVVKKTYKDTDIKNVYSVEDSDGKIYYEVDVLKNGKTVEAYYNKDGTEIED
jgi:hypothetical protein